MAEEGLEEMSVRKEAEAEAKDDPFIPPSFTAGKVSYGNRYPECPKVPIANSVS